jgi:1-aminocyclopropane-1-carboxylate deaminase
MNYLSYNRTPVQEVNLRELEERGVKLLIKREDLNHATVSGNKWWKLKHNLIKAREQKLDTVLTFGGAYSNHIYATAAAASLIGMKSIGIIRGEESTPLNQTLSFAKENGMILHFISREDYRLKSDPSFIRKLTEIFGDFYLIPEGGTNKLAVTGCKEFCAEIADVNYDVLMLPVGTAGTISGITAGVSADKRIIGVPVLKNGGFLFEEIVQLVAEIGSPKPQNCSFFTDYHFGGYAKFNDTLIHFIRMMKQDHNLPLDHVYTAKLMYAIVEEVKKGNFVKGTTILAIHTGGLQGATLGYT